jgi:hypothetical protein
MEYSPLHIGIAVTLLGGMRGAVKGLEAAAGTLGPGGERELPAPPGAVQRTQDLNHLL